MSEAMGELIALGDVPKQLPRRGGKRLHISTVYRWHREGLRGQVLHTRLVGGRRFTTLEWIEEFFAEVNAAADAGREQKAPPPDKSAEHVAAMAMLEAMGM